MKHADPLFLLVEAHDADPERGGASADSPQARALLQRITAGPQDVADPQAEHDTMRRLRATWPTRLAAAGAVAAVAAVAGIGYSQLSAEDAPAPVAVASGVSILVVPSGECSVRDATPQEAAGAAWFLGSEDLPLFRVDAVQTNGCTTSQYSTYSYQGWPGAAYVEIDPATQALTGAITFWPRYTGPVSDGGDDVSEITVGGADALLRYTGHESWQVDWEHGDAQWQITSSGVDESTVREIAEIVETTGTTDALPQSVDGFDRVDLGEEPRGPAVLVDLSYTEDAVTERTGDALFLELRPSIPWEATVSVGTYLGPGADPQGVRVVDLGGTPGLYVDNGGPSAGTLTWNLPSGQTARLWGTGTLERLVESATSLVRADADDPRVVDNLNQREDFVGR
ncbi:hypothetical protein Sked_29990 [Sanguibacter keddieii DSM 10542]|uniref:DUF4367 domain-containing protein n=1 Tax=Sanguibacter keddieii (strain ATCC 51767 / DSM 10542 / NCFB 3025 / ST-74) TaxID=446469 RepID=D1BCB3_SANKS|nr:hypothetical protein [Sanguibacter keddieii]ACZ22900.1 hypothetical protein Sked_29990 [Sanguibacter keddieii DSM 10542]